MSKTLDVVFFFISFFTEIKINYIYYYFFGHVMYRRLLMFCYDVMKFCKFQKLISNLVALEAFGECRRSHLETQYFTFQ